MVALSFFVAMSALLMNTVGFLLMQKERAVELLRDQAGRDALTGIANRREFLRQAEASVAHASRERTSLALLMVDVDHFKRVNDTYGHLAGDAVLRAVADRVRLRVRRQDLLARFGGEEFVLLLAEERSGALAVASQLQEAFRERPILIDGHSIPITLSIGAHVRTPEAVDGVVDRMIAAADLALYSAKQRGRDRIDIAD
jgi:diguanylate cyclase (GGDEF)-like protein